MDETSNAVTDKAAVTYLTPGQTQDAESQALHEKYLRRSLVAFDQFVNALTDGDLDETISARAARAAENGKQWGIELCKFLNAFQANHGPQAQAGDLARAEKVVALETNSGAVSPAPEPEIVVHYGTPPAPEALDLLNAKNTQSTQARAERNAVTDNLPLPAPEPELICGHTETLMGVQTGRTCKLPVGHDAGDSLIAHQY